MRNISWMSLGFQNALTGTAVSDDQQDSQKELIGVLLIMIRHLFGSI